MKGIRTVELTYPKKCIKTVRTLRTHTL